MNAFFFVSQGFFLTLGLGVQFDGWGSRLSSSPRFFRVVQEPSSCSKDIRDIVPFRVYWRNCEFYHSDGNWVRVYRRISAGVVVESGVWVREGGQRWVVWHGQLSSCREDYGRHCATAFLSQKLFHNNASLQVLLLGFDTLHAFVSAIGNCCVPLRNWGGACEHFVNSPVWVLQNW